MLVHCLRLQGWTETRVTQWKRDKEKKRCPVLYSVKLLCGETDDLSTSQYNNARSPVQQVNKPFSQKALNPAWCRSRSLSLTHAFLALYCSCTCTVLYCKYLNEDLWELLQWCRLCVQRRHVFASVYFTDVTTCVGAPWSHPVLSGSKNQWVVLLHRNRFRWAHWTEVPALFLGTLAKPRVTVRTPLVWVLKAFPNIYASVILCL